MSAIKEEEEEETMDTTGGGGGGGGGGVPAPDEDDRKLFVGGLHQEARDSDIREHFGQFGAIEGVTLKTDAHTGRSRGFAFVVFKELAGVDAAVAAEEHTIRGKKVAVKKAQSKQGKVYVGKLKGEISDDEVREAFSQYGAIAAIEQPFDKIKNERKNFCFITFEREEPAKRLIKEGVVSVKGHELEVKKVTQKPDPRAAMGGPMGYGMGGGRGGGGRGAPWGGYGGGGGGGWGGYGDYYGAYGMDPYYGAAGWGGYAGAAAAGWGYSGGGGGGGMASSGAAGYGATGGKSFQARGAPRGRAAAPARGQRQKPY